MRLNSLLLDKRSLLLKACGFLLLLIVSFLLEYNPIQWFYGYQLGLGTAFLIIALLLFGITGGLTAAAIVYGSLVLLESISWLQALTQAAYFVAVGLLLRRFPDKVIMLTFLYWILAGCPASYYVYRYETGFGDDLGYLYCLNVALGSILSALAADIILSHTPIRRWLGASGERNGYAFHRIVLHLTLVATSLPFVIYILVSGYQHRADVLVQATDNLNTQVGVVNRELAGWTDSDYRSLRLNGIVQYEQLKQGMLMNAGSHIPTKLALLDSNSRATSVVGLDESLIGEPFDWKLGGDFRHLNATDAIWTPSRVYTYDSEAWRYAYFVRETTVGADKRAVFLMPFTPYLQESISSYIAYIQLLLVFVAATMMLTSLLNRLFFRSLTRLARATIDFPGKLSLDRAIDWPRSGISEIRMLADNFRSVAEHLTDNIRRLAHSEARLFQLAYYDSLTELPNRLNMKERLAEELEAAERSGWSEYLSVLFIDLDRFKHINDTLGHIAGDCLLRLTAERLKQEQTEQSFMARISGDEFVVLLRHAEPDEAVHLSERILAQFEGPFLLQGHSLYITPSIGIATAPIDGRDIDTLMKNADSAMYAAKEQGGKGYSAYSEAATAKLSESMWLENSLHHALNDKQFELYYQPKVDNLTGEIAGAEALVRWHHPERGLIGPCEFMAVAENTGLIIPLGSWILREACEQHMRWRAAGLAPRRIAVNLSARQFHDPRLVERICDILDDTGMLAEELELEITESYIFSNEAYVVSVLEQLRGLGVYISIDDFGTGYSSLSQLQRFPVQAIKIDRSFISGMGAGKGAELIVKAVIELAHGMSMKVVAEGVETDQEAKLLRHYRCDELQGYLFGKPMPAASFERFLTGAKAERLGG
ncbi:putative bifunctional diguanylate cyclase/phosphodiesterase [Cohnella panacarvi]|uniref:putative bifunctional diguanylate cyclase/phosphodiesterase n=1 Tax=Cohnella panacarvi TaxID=400776 RepID=UPI00047A45FD|nr:EAL domain-containing protein [Cohnella panacarvi]